MHKNKIMDILEDFRVGVGTKVQEAKGPKHLILPIKDYEKVIKDSGIVKEFTNDIVDLLDSKFSDHAIWKTPEFKEMDNVNNSEESYYILQSMVMDKVLKELKHHI